MATSTAALLRKGATARASTFRSRFPASHSRLAPRQGRASSVRVQASSLAELKEKFTIPGSVEIEEGRGGLPKVVLKHVSGSQAEVYLYGAVTTSWTQPSGDEVLYVRPDAVFDKSKPISGGIPHCFPQFGPGAIQQHGFARNLDWSISSTSADRQPDDREPEVELVLTENDYTTAMWPHKFKAVYSVCLHGEQLKTDLRVINTGDTPFDFTAGLHTYIEVLHISKARVLGLKGLDYLDKTADPKNPANKKDERDALVFEGPVDSVYLNAPSHVELDVGTGAAVAIDSENWPDVVVWSPWTAMPDSYEHFCCVENVKYGSPAVVAPGESWRAQTTMQVVDVNA